jgi:hypothetical protein
VHALRNALKDEVSLNLHQIIFDTS